MELYQLKYLVEAVQSGSIVKAAENLFVSQPAVSQALVRLEAELNAKIYIRKEKVFTLTDTGKLLYVYAQRIIYEMDDFFQEFKRASLDDVLNIISVDSGFDTFLLPMYLVDHQEVKVTNQVVEASLIKKMVEGANIDLAVSDRNLTSNTLKSIKLMDLGLYVLVPRGNPLENKSMLTLQDLKEQPFIRFKTDCSYIQRFTRQIDTVSDNLNIIYEGNETSWNVMQRKRGFFFFINSYRLLNSDIYPYHKVVPLDPTMFSEPMYITYKRDSLKQGVTDFVAGMKENMKMLSKNNFYCKSGLLKLYF